MKLSILIAVFAFAKVCTTISIKDQWKTWNNSTIPKICDSLQKEDSVEIFNESFLLYKFLFQTEYADWHGDILEVINLAIHGNATRADLVKIEKLLNGIDTLDHTINEQDLMKLQEELVTFSTPSQTNYTMTFYRAYSAEDLSTLHTVIVSLFSDARKATLDLTEKELSEVISHNNLLKEIHNNEQLCTQSFMDGFIYSMRFQNCFILPLSGYFCNRENDNQSKEDFEEDYDKMVLYYQYIIDTPSGEVKRDVLEVVNLAVNGNATTRDLAKFGHVLNNTAKFNDQGVEKLVDELSKFQTLEQTNSTLAYLKSMSRDDPDFKTFIADLFDKANKTLLNLSEINRSEIISRNKLLKTIQKYEKKCPNTLLDIFLIGVKNRNCLEPTLENYCSGMKRSPNIDGFSLWGEDPTPTENFNSLYLFFKYIRGTAINTAQRDVFDVIHLAVNRNATTRDYVKVEKLLNDIGSINRVEELFPKVQTELATFQSTEQIDFTINFYRSLKENVGAARAAIADLFEKANTTILNLPEKHRSVVISRNDLVREIYRNEQLCD